MRSCTYSDRPKVLFLPSYLGGGFGHIGRCLSLAQALDEKGWQPAFALGGQHTSRVQAGGYPVFRLRRPFEPILDQGDGPAFTVFSDLGFQLLRDRLNSSSSIRAALAEQLAVLRRWKPDILVSDSWLLADILGHLAGIPVVQVVRTATHPAVRQLIWWQEPPADLLAPDPLPLFNPMLMDLRVPPIEHAEDLLRGSLYLVPGITELDPLPGDLPGTFYTGPLTRQKKANKSLPDWLEDPSSDRPIVYVTLGGGAGPVGGPEFYRLLFDALADLPIQVIASTGARFSPDDLVAAPPNFRIEAWVPGPELIKRSRLVVYPGGYGTTMELVESGIPGLVIPFHSEQESNGRRLEAAGAGKVLLPSGGQPELVRGVWPGGEFAYQVYHESSLTPPMLQTAVSEVLEKPHFVQNARRLQKEAALYGGSAFAADLIQRFYEKRLPASGRGWDRLNWRQKLSLTVFSGF